MESNMQRKEMIEKMVNTLSEYDFSEYQNLYSIAEDMLGEAERLGMKPPCSCVGDTSEKGYGPNCGISWHLHEWDE